MERVLMGFGIHPGVEIEGNGTGATFGYDSEVGGVAILTDAPEFISGHRRHVKCAFAQTIVKSPSSRPGAYAAGVDFGKTRPRKNEGAGEISFDHPMVFRLQQVRLLIPERIRPIQGLSCPSQRKG